MATSPSHAPQKRSEANDRLLCQQCPYTPFSASARLAVPGELSDQRIPTVEDAVKLGEEIEVKVIAVDGMGPINLSRPALTDKTPRQDDRRVSKTARSGAMYAYCEA